MRRKLLTIWLIIMLLAQSGCAVFWEQGQDEYVDIDLGLGGQQLATSAVPPQTRHDGTPFTLAYEIGRAHV